MPGTKSKVAATKTTKPATKNGINSNLELTRAIQRIIKNQGDFMESVKILGDYSSETLYDLTLQIDNKKSEIEILQTEYDNTLINNKIKTKQYYDEYKYEGAIAFISERGEIPIDENKLTELYSSVENIKNEHKDEIEAVISEQSDKYKKILAMTTHSLELKHKADIAELTACVNQQKKEIITLHSAMDKLHNDISAQRELTKDVASA